MTATETSTPIPQQGVDELAARLDGRVIRPSEAGFDEAMRIWNGMITKAPGVVFQAASVDDVALAIGFARDDGLELSIKGGGHHIAGLALSDGGLTIDFSQMRGVEVYEELVLVSDIRFTSLVRAPPASLSRRRTRRLPAR